MSSTTSTVSYATAAGTGVRQQTLAKYVPVHKRSPPSSRRSPSPTPSDVSSTSTLVTTQPRVYTITTLLHLANDPEIKLISVAQKDRLRDVVPEIVMNRKMRKTMEYHAIQDRVRAKTQTLALSASPHPHDISDDIIIKLPQQQQRQRPGIRRQGRSGVERRRNVGNVVEEASWRTLRRLPSSLTAA